MKTVSAFTGRVLSTTIILLLMLSNASAGPARSNLIVVELFISQDCILCLPVAHFHEELAQHEGVLALTMYVKYLDYIGWQNTLALDASLKRQRKYAERFDLRYIYTPQIVVNGQREFLGSARKDIVNLIDNLIEQAKTMPRIPISLTETAPGMLSLSIGAGETQEPADIFLVFFDAQKTINVTHGKDAGLSYTIFNVARKITQIGRWTGQPMNLMIEALQSTHDFKKCAVIVQMAGLGPVLAAVEFQL